MKISSVWMIAAILTFCGTISAQAQVMKTADLEKDAHQRELRDKNDVIIREIRENAQLRDELRDAWQRERQKTNE